MAETVGEIQVRATLDDADLERGLRRIDAELEAEKRKIERDRAEWKIDVDIKDLERKLKQANQKLQAAEDEATTIEDKAERRRAQNRASYQRKRVQELQDAIDLSKEHANSTKRERKELELTEREVSAIQKAEDARAKAFEAAEKRRQAELRRTASEEAKLSRQRERDARVAESIRTRAERDARKAEVSRQRELSQIPTMRRQYAELTRTVEKLQEARRRAHDNKSQTIIDLKIDEAVAKMRALHDVLERVGSPVDLEVDLHPGRDLGLTLRRHLGSNPGLLSAAAAIGADIGDHMGRGLRRRFRDVTNKGVGGVLKDVGSRAANIGLSGLSRINRLLQGLSEATIRLGPFTSSIRQAIVGMSLFAPIILDLVGALGSLVSVVGSASVGAIGTLTAGFGAFGVVLGSTGALLVPLMRDFKNLNTLQGAYHKQVLKTGANSDKAKTKLAEFNHALGSVSESTRQAFLGISKIQDQFRGLSHQARPAFLTALGEGLTTLRTQLHHFGPEMVQSFNLVAHGFAVVARGLRSPEANSFFQTMFDQGQRALPAFGRALGNVARSIANVAKAFSAALPSLGNGFEAWTEGILKFTQNGEKMAKLVDTTVGSMRRFGHFTQAAAKFLTVFFGAGVGAGDSFLTTMTNALNRWSEFLQTTKGRNNLQQFFRESVHGAEVFYAALTPIISSFVRWAAMIAPWARLFFEAASGVTQFVAQFLRLTGLQGPLSALVTTLGVLWGIGKIGAATQAIVGFTRALLGLAGAERDVAAAQKLSQISNILGGGTRAGGRTTPFIPIGMQGPIAGTLEKTGATAAKTAGRFTLLRTAAARSATALGTFASVATGPVGLGLAAATYGAFKLYEAHTRLSEGMRTLLANDDKLNEGIELQSIRTKDLAGAATQVAQAHLTEEQAQKTVNALRKHGKQGTDQYKQALINLRYAQQQVTQAQEEWKQQSNDLKSASQQQIDAAKANIEQRKKERDDIKETIDGYAKMGRPLKANSEYYDRLRTAEQALKGEQEALAQAEARSTLAHVNQQRALRMLPPIALSAWQVIERLNKSIGKTRVAKIALKFPDPRQAQQVMNSLDATIRSGVPGKRAFNVVANSKNAEEALRRLNSIKLTPKRLEIIEKGGKEAVRMIERITGQTIPKKLVPIIERGGPAAMQVLRDIFHFNLPNKKQNINQQGGASVLGVLLDIARKRLPDKTFKAILRDLASGGLGNILARLNALHDKTVTVTTRTRGGGTFNVPVTGGGHARGGVATPEEKRANNIPSAWSQNTQGGMYQKPTFLVGEEAKPEYVIATNPSYRKANIGYWMDAAKALGIPGFASGGFVGSGYFTSTDVQGVPQNNVNPLSGRNFNKQLASAKKGKKYKGTRKQRSGLHNALRNTDLSSVSYVRALLTQADDLDREYSIREGEQMPEPETFIKQTGTDEKTGDPIYGIDQDAIDAYAASFNPLIEVKDALVKVFANLVTAIPQALAQLSARKQRAQINAAALKKDITIAEARIEAEQKKKKDKKGNGGPNQAKIKALRKRISDDKEELRFTEKLGTDAQNDYNDLQGEQKEAGFSYREETDAAQGLRNEVAALSGRAQREADQSNPQPEKPSPPPSPDDPTTGLTPDQQAQLDQAATLQAIVTRGNFLNSAAVSAFGSSGDIGTGGFTNAFSAAVNESMATSMAAGSSLASNYGLVGNIPSGGALASPTGTPTGSFASGDSGGGSTTIINVNTLHPADPATLDAIGQAATAGMSLQGNVISPRVVTGL